MTSATLKPRAGEHTKGPWRIEGPSSGKLKGFDDGGDYAIMFCGHIIAETFRRASETVDYPAEANARRIVACVNACEAMDDPDAEIADVMENVRLLRIERDLLRERERELVEALKTVAALSDSGMITTGKPLRDAVEHARALLAKHGR